jgi:23S rRNA (cytidine1920-2'-O)/16S rRNA (cytidine1409-2'-O)-methyltransferase
LSKLRLDQLLVETGLAPSRQKAQALILSGAVLVEDVPVDKAGTRVAVDAAIRIRGAPSKYVGRGGEKIEAAFDYFQIALTGVIAIDVGSSTGGFTDCLLQRGAAQVYAVDVGYNQLDFKLRQDPRVVVMEKTHAAELRAGLFSPSPTLAVIDVSFIGLRKILQPVVQVLASPKQVLALVKPQFELGPESVGKGGVVRDVEAQLAAVRLVTDFAKQIGLVSQGFLPSPLKGSKKGNQEYFVYFSS